MLLRTQVLIHLALAPRQIFRFWGHRTESKIMEKRESFSKSPVLRLQFVGKAFPFNKGRIFEINSPFKPSFPCFPGINNWIFELYFRFPEKLMYILGIYLVFEFFQEEVVIDISFMMDLGKFLVEASIFEWFLLRALIDYESQRIESW